MPLDWEHVDLAANVIRVRLGWDLKERVFVAPKSKAGVRTVPLLRVLRDRLIAHRLRSGRSSGLVFGGGDVPFDCDPTMATAKKAWKAAKLTSIGLHECRHTFASLLIAAGVNANAVCTVMGHSSIAITLDRYGHLMPGGTTRRPTSPTSTSTRRWPRVDALRVGGGARPVCLAAGCRRPRG
jgi:integrase